MIATIVISILLAAVVTLIIRSLVKNKKKGKHSCSGCAGCSLSRSCHKRG